MCPLFAPPILCDCGVAWKHLASIETLPGDVNDRIIFQVRPDLPRGAIFPLTKQAQSDY